HLFDGHVIKCWLGHGLFPSLDADLQLGSACPDRQSSGNPCEVFPPLTPTPMEVSMITLWPCISTPAFRNARVQHPGTLFGIQSFFACGYVFAVPWPGGEN